MLTAYDAFTEVLPPASFVTVTPRLLDLLFLSLAFPGMVSPRHACPVFLDIGPTSESGVMASLHCRLDWIWNRSG